MRWLFNLFFRIEPVLPQQSISLRLDSLNAGESQALIIWRTSDNGHDVAADQKVSGEMPDSQSDSEAVSVGRGFRETLPFLHCSVNRALQIE